MCRCRVEENNGLVIVYCLQLNFERRLGNAGQLKLYSQRMKKFRVGISELVAVSILGPELIIDPMTSVRSWSVARGLRGGG